MLSLGVVDDGRDFVGAGIDCGGSSGRRPDGIVDRGHRGDVIVVIIIIAVGVAVVVLSPGFGVVDGVSSMVSFDQFDVMHVGWIQFCFGRPRRVEGAEDQENESDDGEKSPDNGEENGRVGVLILFLVVR